jgi:transposase
VRKMLRNDQWERIEHLLPGKAGDCGVTAKDNRQFVEAILWIARTGSPWRDLPESSGNWHNVYTRFSRWGKTGVWQRIVAVLGADTDLQSLLLDSTVVRAHQHAAGAQKKRANRPSDARAAD